VSHAPEKRPSSERSEGRVERPPWLDRAFARLFGDDDDTRFGAGWISGAGSVFLGAVALLGVVVFWFPGALSTAAFRARYPIGLLRGVLEGVIAAAFTLGALSMALRRRKVLGAVGVSLSLLATLGGGGDVPVEGEVAGTVSLGLDWFLLNLLLLTVVFVPLERAFARLPDQTTFRAGWTTDGVHFMISHLAVQALTFVTLLPARALMRAWDPGALREAVASQPLGLQWVEVVVVADLGQYWIHRAFHRVPFLWRFHAVHHSSRALDWLAGSRLHLVDVVITRGLVLVPVMTLGFSPAAVYAYVVFVSFHAVFIHANVRFRFGWLDHVLATPRGHHWHHAVTPVDKNFAVHLPVLDRLFGTLHLPGDEWPSEYGIDGPPVPAGWWAQLRWPLASASRRGPPRMTAPSP
jgi:lathosterol oxidase